MQSEEGILNLKVLYVEDEIDTQEPMTRFLRRRFASVSTAWDGEEGWKKFNEIHPDLLITDLLMPESSGIDLVKKVRAAEFKGPIIITSALQDVDLILKTVDLGISKYMIKPINMTELDGELRKFGEEIAAKQKKNFDMPILKKKECEAEIKHCLSNILKKYSGKGPRDIKVFIGSDRIEATCLNVRTSFEETLYQNGKNIALVEQGRRLFYQIIRADIEQAVSEILETRIHVRQIGVNATADADVITLGGDENESAPDRFAY